VGVAATSGRLGLSGQRQKSPRGVDTASCILEMERRHEVRLASNNLGSTDSKDCSQQVPNHQLNLIRIELEIDRVLYCLYGSSHVILRTVLPNPLPQPQT
jgi:hypothetical protein